MMQPQSRLSSSLSPRVKHLVIDIGATFQQQKIVGKLSFLCENGTFEWDSIAPLLGEISDDFKIEDQISDWFLCTTRRLWSVFLEAHHVFMTSDEQFREHLWDLCSWTNKQEDIKRECERFLAREISTTEAILYLTSLLERFIGNIYLLKGNKVPFLLKDLLAAPELSEILGTIPVVFLQMLMGTPAALNLRNIAWHGFLKPDEIHRQLVSTLFLVIPSLGELLDSRNILLNLIPKRELKYFEPEIFEGCFPSMKDDLLDILKIIHVSPYLTIHGHVYWKKALKYYFDGRYGHCLLLLIPHLENMLRCIFCTVNECPERILTAESTVMYTTLTEILAEKISVNGDQFLLNKMRNALGDNIVEMLQDLFLHQAGPRLRDRLSHGECDLGALSARLANHVICIALVIIMKMRGYSSHHDKNCSFITKMMNAHDLYVSQYHPSSILKKTILALIWNLGDWEEYPVPIFDEQCDNIPDDDGDVLLLQNQMYHILEALDINIKNNTENRICNIVLSMKVETIFRPKAEAEILSILSRIVDNINYICSQIEHQFKTNFVCFVEHKMRTRRRETYRRMLGVISYLKKVIICVILIVVMSLHKLNFLTCMPATEIHQSIKFLKKTLCFVENLVSQTSLDKNKWLEAKALGQKFCHDVGKKLNEDKRLFILTQIVL